MKFVYIDDSFLRESPFLEVMRSRLFSFCKKRNVTHIFISGSASLSHAQAFYACCQNYQFSVLQGPACFEIEDCKGTLNDCSLMINEFRLHHICSGNAIYGDSERGFTERIYFELFQHQVQDELVHHLEEELRSMLVDVAKKRKKTTIFH